jgi:Flp pilus assembly pilin Flp
MKQEKGQGLVEYALIIGFVVMACVVVVSLFGDHVNENFYTIINDALNI